MLSPEAVQRSDTPSELPRVTVIVPVRDDNHRLRLCLEALAGQTYPAERTEILVVDNGSQEPPADTVNLFPFARLLHEPRPGSYAARNKGLTVAHGSLIAFTDADCIPAPDWIERGVGHFAAAPDCGILAGRIEITVRAEPTIAELYERVAAFPQRRYALRQHFAATANAWVRQSVLASLKGFNDQLLSGGDAEFGRRAHGAGFRVCYGASVVVQHPARDLRELLRKQRRVAHGLRQRKATCGRATEMREALAVASMIFPFWSAMRIAGEVRESGLAARAHVPVRRVLALLPALALPHRPPTPLKRTDVSTIAWLLSGGEDYGVRRTTLGFMRQLEATGIRASAIALSSGSIVRDLQQAGHEVVAFDDDDAPPQLGGTVPRKVMNGVRMLRYRTRMSGRVAAAVKADVVHVRWPQLVGLAGEAAQRAGARAVWQMPNVIGTTLPFGLNRRYLRRLCRKFDVLPIANSRYTATTLADGDSVPPHAHLGIDPEEFDPNAHDPIPRSTLEIPQDATVLGVFARLQPSKGQAELIAALADLVHVAPELHLMIVGGAYPQSPGFEEQLRQLARSRAVDRRVHFIGRVSEPQPYFLAADVVVSSTVGAEPFGLSVIEAMMMGRPVLAHSLGGPGETVSDGRTGWLVDGATPADLARGIERAMADRPRWMEMGRLARAHATERFSMSAAVDRYLRIVRECGQWIHRSGW